MSDFVQVNTSSPYARTKPIGYVVRESGCWEWVSGSSAKYGRISVNGKEILAHRWMYEQRRGPVPAGLELDHLCRNTVCVNPDHLEPVTHRENVLRGIAPAAIHARKTHCPRGHKLAGENLRSYELRMGRRICRQCKNDWMRERSTGRRDAA